MCYDCACARAHVCVITWKSSVLFLSVQVLSPRSFVSVRVVVALLLRCFPFHLDFQFSFYFPNLARRASLMSFARLKRQQQPATHPGQPRWSYYDVIKETQRFGSFFMADLCNPHTEPQQFYFLVYFVMLLFQPPRPRRLKLSYHLLDIGKTDYDDVVTAYKLPRVGVTLTDTVVSSSSSSSFFSFSFVFVRGRGGYKKTRLDDERDLYKFEYMIHT